jgi:hypothetical protein
VAATGTWTVIDAEIVEIVEQGQQCLIHAVTTIGYTGTLTGVTETVGLADSRVFATCEEAAASGFAGIRSNFHAVEHFVGEDGAEATFVSVREADANGDFEGGSALHGGLHGTIKQVRVPGTDGGTYEGRVVLG